MNSDGNHIKLFGCNVSFKTKPNKHQYIQRDFHWGQIPCPDGIKWDQQALLAAKLN